MKRFFVEAEPVIPAIIVFLICTISIPEIVREVRSASSKQPTTMPSTQPSTPAKGGGK